MTIRQQVLEQIIDVMREAEDQGRDGFKVAEATFPGTPDPVLLEARAEMDYRRTEQWWTTVERTIDGEIIRQALVAKDGEEA